MEKRLKLITEEYTDIQIVESINNNSRDFYLEGIYSTANLENKNGRIYLKSTLDREINKLMPTILEKKLYGEVNHPQESEINLERVAILIEQLVWNGDNILGKSYILETPLGNLTKAIVKKGKIGISSRGLGTVDENSCVNHENYQLITWDVVNNPSNHPSWVKGICESKVYIMNENGIIIRQESILSEKEKTEALNDALSDNKQKEKEIIEMVSENELISESEALQIYQKLLHEQIKETLKNLL